MISHRISVRELVEFVYRSGSLDLRFQGKSKMADGIKIHQKIQKSQGSDYQAEVPLQRTVSLVVDESRVIELTVSGRADGILSTQTGVVIDEIKGTSEAVDEIKGDEHPVHWAQAKIYGAIYSKDHGLEAMDIQLTYANFDTGEINRIREHFLAKELEQFLEETVLMYKKWLILKSDWILERTQRLSDSQFPFERYREGQRALAVSVYNTVKESGVLFAEAPTGIGKTVSTLFPALKAMGQGVVDRIFYLSAKTITKTVAEEAVQKMQDFQPDIFKLRTITLTAKDKVCINAQVTCYPEKCQYAEHYYDKSLDALWDVLTSTFKLSKELIQTYAQKHKVCPYEFSLDCALFSDLIICDYNYAFDPRVYLRRFFELPTESYVFLVDEAHNLVDRARMMYSAEIHKDKFYEVKKNLSTGEPIHPADKKVIKALEGINKVFLAVRKKCDQQGVYVDKDEISDIYEQLKRRATVIEKWLSENHLSPLHEDVLSVYFDILGYMRISELYDEGYVFYITDGDNPKTTIKLYNINPATQLKRFIDNSRATVFFSATLTPLLYYKTLLTGDIEIKTLGLSSPFDISKRKTLFATDVSIKYKDREQTMPQVVEYVQKMVRGKVGNYMVFLPSYTYLNTVYKLFEDKHGMGYDIIRQAPELTEDEKTAFLDLFHEKSLKRMHNGEEKSLIGFAVLGGHFSEGIDLKGDVLIGVMVVGVGLPMIGFENELIKQYFDERAVDGFRFAYQYPGINKVMQSAGRVIRSEEDKGVVILVDQRYATGYYNNVLPKDWGNTLTNLGAIDSQLNAFWEEHS